MDGGFQVKGSPGQRKEMDEIAFAAYTNTPPDEEVELEDIAYYDPLEMTYPFGAYICVVDIDPGTGQVNVRRRAAQLSCCSWATSRV